MNAPSINSLVNGLKITVEQAKQIRKQFHEDKPQKALELANTFMNTHGVETITNRVGRAILSYANTGDTYKTTLLYNHQTDYAWIGNWGTFVETSGDKYQIN